MNAVRWALWFLAAWSLTVLISLCSGCRLPPTTPAEQRALDVTAIEWRKALPWPSDCDYDRLRVMRGVTPLSFTQYCRGCPLGDPCGFRELHGCLYGGQVVISPGHPTPLRVVVHEALHWLMDCRGDSDPGHVTRGVWRRLGEPEEASIEGRAKAALGR